MVAHPATHPAQKSCLLNCVFDKPTAKSTTCRSAGRTWILGLPVEALSSSMSSRAPGVCGSDPEARPLATTVEAALAVERADVGVLLYLEAGVIWSCDTRLDSSPTGTGSTFDSGSIPLAFVVGVVKQQICS